MLETLGASTKALIGLATRSAAIKSIPFPTSGATPYASGAGYRDGNFWTAGYYNSSPGSQYDYNADAGELLDNSIIAAGEDLLSQALPSAPPVLKEYRGGKWEVVEDSEEAGLLLTPMQPDKTGHTNGYGGFHLWNWVIKFEMTRGEAFWVVDYGAGGKPAQLRVERPEDMRVLPSATRWIDGYELMVDGKPYKLKDKEVIHFRHALNHHNPRRGWCPALSGKRHVAGDNRAATYQSALMRNVSAIGLLISVKDGESAARMTPQQVELFTESVNFYNGENAGKSKGVNLPLDVHKLGLTPDEMALDKLIGYYETRICALIGIDPMLLSLGGSENRTYSNYAEAEEALWRRCIMPRRTRHTSELGSQYLPLFGRDPAKYRIDWDYSEVGALQEDKDALHVRVREDYKAGGIDRYTFLVETGREAKEEDRKVYATGTQGDDEQAPVVSGDEAETQTSADETKAVWVESEHPRAADGKFGQGGGTVDVSQSGAFLSAKISGGLVGGTVKDGKLTITHAELPEEHQGKGYGKAMYRALIDHAHGLGLKVFSDSTVEMPAVRVYESLKKEGYDVVRLPGGGELPPDGGLPFGALYGKGADSPVYEIRPKKTDGAKSLYEFKKYDPRQPRDDHGKWTDSGGRLSVGHTIHVMKHEGISDEAHHAAVREAIESGRHKTREDVLRHIDSIHAASKAPEKTTVKNVTHAAEILKGHGVKEVNLPANKDLAQLAVSAVEIAKTAGHRVPSEISTLRAGSGGIAYASGDSIGLTRSRFNTADFERQVKSGWWSQANPVLHEIGHVNHQKLTGERYDRLKYWQHSAHEEIAAKVSKYATRNPVEFVAEVFAGHLSGVRYPEDVMKVYKLMEGPELK